MGLLFKNNRKTDRADLDRTAPEQQRSSTQIMEALTMDNVGSARNRLLTMERHLQHIVDHFCSHELPSSEAAWLITPFIQDIDEALRELRAAQCALDIALITAGVALTDPLSR